MAEGFRINRDTNLVELHADDGIFLVQLTPDELRRAAIDMCLAADRLEGKTSPPSMVAMAAPIAGNA